MCNSAKYQKAILAWYWCWKQNEIEKKDKEIHIRQVKEKVKYVNNRTAVWNMIEKKMDLKEMKVTIFTKVIITSLLATPTITAI